MSFRYKSALVSLASLALGYGWYFGFLLINHGVPREGPLVHLTLSVVITTLLTIVGHIAIAVTSPEPRGPMDERERAFDARATAIGYRVLVVGALAAAATLHFDFSRPGMANAIVLSIVVAECARQAKFLKLHHSAA